MNSPNGIIRMSREIDKLVETSLNLGVLKSDDTAVTLRYAVRSSVGVAKKSLKNPFGSAAISAITLALSFALIADSLQSVSSDTASLRSGSDALNSSKNQLVCIAGAFAAEVTFEGDYPAWEYKKDSKLREESPHSTPA